MAETAPAYMPMAAGRTRNEAAKPHTATRHSAARVAASGRSADSTVRPSEMARTGNSSSLVNTSWLAALERSVPAAPAHALKAAIPSHATEKPNHASPSPAVTPAVSPAPTMSARSTMAMALTLRVA